ncbi:MAG TPA: YqgE/AlgH family protein [Myxococcota bacterium]|jgi:putative transcriptional regulator
MRASSIVITSVLCLSSAIAVQGYMLRSQQIEDEEAFTDDDCGTAGADMGADDSDIDVVTAPEDAPTFDGRGASVTGRLLVAAPGMQDPYFAGTVIFMVADDEDGSLGVVLNRPRGAVVHAARGLAHLWDGGPVGRDRVFVLHDDLKSEGSVVIHGVAVAAEPAILDDVMEGNGPEHARVFVGYAGWGPGQLTREMQQGAWIVADATAAQILSDDPAKLSPTFNP